MLHQDDIADHEIRGDETRQLIVREVPWLDAEQDANWATLNGCFARVWGKRLRRKEALRALGVVVDDVCAQSDFTAAFGDELAHLQGDEIRKFPAARTQDPGGLRQDSGPLDESLYSPYCEAGLRLRERAISTSPSVCSANCLTRFPL